MFNIFLLSYQKFLMHFIALVVAVTVVVVVVATAVVVAHLR